MALNLVESGMQVTGVDASKTLIGLCRERMPDQEWIVGDMRSIALKRKFGGILAWDSFFHLQPEYQRSMFDVFAAHARPSAMLMFNTGPAYGEAVGCYRGDPLYHASLTPLSMRFCLRTPVLSLSHTSSKTGTQVAEPFGWPAHDIDKEVVSC